MTEKQKKFYKALIYDKINILEVANRYNISRQATSNTTAQTQQATLMAILTQAWE